MVIGKRKREIDLVVPAKYTGVTTDNVTAKIFLPELKKKKEKYKNFDLDLITEQEALWATYLTRALGASIQGNKSTAAQ